MSDRAEIVIDIPEVVIALDSPSGDVPVMAPVGIPGAPGTTDHGALTGLADDDHPQYLNDARGDARYSSVGHNHDVAYDAAGAATAAVGVHVAAVDPHPQYFTTAEGDARYDVVGAAAAAQSAAIQRANHTGVQAIGTVTGLQAALDGKSAIGHGHAIADVTGLQTAIDGKEAAGVAAGLVSAHAAALDPHPQYKQAAGVNALIAAAVGTVTQAYSATLGLLAAVVTTAFGRDFLALADAAAGRVKLGLANVAATGSYADLTGTPAAYSLPVASGAVLGGVKSSASITVAGDGTLGVGATITGPAGSLLTIASAAGQDITLAPANGTLTVTNSSLLLSTGRQFRINSDVFWGRAGAAIWQAGNDGAAPIAQTISACGGRNTVDTNVAGANLTVRSGTGTGNAAGSTLTLATPEPGASGTTSQTQTARVTVKGNLIGLGSGATTPTAVCDMAGDTQRLRTARTPASATAAGNTGDMCWDATYLYVCVATNTWRRVAHASW